MVYGCGVSRLYPGAREHAWLVRGGEVVELTAAWNAPTWYWGIRIPAAVIELLEEKHSTEHGIGAYRALVTVEEGDSEEGDRMVRLLREANPLSGGSLIPFVSESGSEEESE